MVRFRIASLLRSALSATALAAAALVLIPAPPATSAAAAPATQPVTCMPHCDNALYPYTEYARASVDAFVPGAPSRPLG
jgi:hypothetical protein